MKDWTPGAARHTETKEMIARTRENQPVIFKEGIVGLPLDKFCEEIGEIPNCIKIDVDGNEWEIFQGGKETFASSKLRTVLLELIETNPHFGECVQFLGDSGLVLEYKNLSNQIWVRKQPL